MLAFVYLKLDHCEGGSQGLLYGQSDFPFSLRFEREKVNEACKRACGWVGWYVRVRGL